MTTPKLPSVADPSPDPVRILGIVDLHWSGKSAPKLPDTSPYDLTLVAGDLTNFCGSREAEVLIDRLAASGTPVFAVCGNCDQPEIEQFLQLREIDLDRRSRELLGIDFLGLSGGLPFGNLPYERTEDEYRTACATLLDGVPLGEEVARPRLLVSHQPAFDSGCDVARGNPVGSHSIRAMVEQFQPDLMFSGHIHESVAIERLGATVVVNPGPWFEGRWAEILVHPKRPLGRRVEVTIHQHSG